VLPAEVLRQVRRLQLRSRRAVQSLFGGEYHSEFKGSGLSYDDVREYQPGDDVRRIDWNVTARTGTAFIKRFIEERELTVMLAVDVSGSLKFGTQSHTKRSAVAELAALLAFCAANDNDRLGAVLFSDRVEKITRPTKGTRHVLRLLRDLLTYEPRFRGTNLRGALDAINKLQKRRAVVFLFSDFQALDYEDTLRRTAQQHDVIAVRMTDERELTLPDVGLLRVQDPETDEVTLLDTSSRTVRERYATQATAHAASTLATLRGCNADVLDIRTDGTHFDSLLRFFRRRAKRRRG